MGFVEAVFYYAIAEYVVPKTREEVPFKQMGYDLDMFIIFFAELGLYEATIFETYKGLVCLYDQDYGYSKRYCPKPESIDTDEGVEEEANEDDGDEEKSSSNLNKKVKRLISKAKGKI